ncbi:Na+/H+ antiporter [Roseomonas sp. CCTCC AB2023176]|uniref:Na+/H+ antiporter n=1 Tax=Roseomonas sp. CCTCC AB2023176 TaxID=3342640 RepID=UPI0035E09035
MIFLELTLLLLVACVAFAVLARRTRIPYAAILVLGGMAMAFVPGLPRLELEPALVLAVFLPPLLQASAWRTDWKEFRFNLRPILLLAVGCVVFTAICVAVVIKAILPDLPWAAALALGAVVAPPDAVAAASVLARLPIPHRMVTVLEGESESLVNDASAIVLFRLAVGALAVGSLSPGLAALQFLVVALGGLAVGFAVARLCFLIFPRLSDTALEIAVSFLSAYAAFILAEAIHVSGVIAVVANGILLARRQHVLMPPRTRLSAVATWQFVEFVLTGLVFLLVGLQLNAILERLTPYGFWFLLGTAAALGATLIVSRFVWVFPATYLPRLLPSVRRTDPPPSPREVTIIAWAGMRGVVSLAVALSLPVTVPYRDLLIFLAFSAILVTLVVQGTTLEWMIRRLGVTVRHAPGMSKREAAARRAMSHAEVAELESRMESPIDGAIARDLIGEYRERARVFTGVAGGGTQAELRARLQMRLAVLRAARTRLLDHHAEEVLPEEMLARLVEETDHEELRLVRQLEQTG